MFTYLFGLKFTARAMFADLLRILVVALIALLALALVIALAIIGFPVALLITIIVLIGLLTRYVDPR